MTPAVGKIIQGTGSARTERRDTVTPPGKVFSLRNKRVNHCRQHFWKIRQTTILITFENLNGNTVMLLWKLIKGKLTKVDLGWQKEILERGTAPLNVNYRKESSITVPKREISTNVWYKKLTIPATQRMRKHYLPRTLTFLQWIFIQINPSLIPPFQ